MRAPHRRQVSRDASAVNPRSISDMSPDSGAPAALPSLRASTPADVDAAGHICYRAFKAIAEQHRFTPDFPDPETAIGLMQHMISRDDVDGVVAEASGRVVGSNF